MSSTLTPEQKEALASFQAVTANADTVESISILQAHDWQLEEAISTMLAAGPTSHTSTSASASPSTSTPTPATYSTTHLTPTSSLSSSSSSPYQPPNYHPPPSFSSYSHAPSSTSSSTSTSSSPGSFMTARSHGDEKQSLLTSSSSSSSPTFAPTSQQSQSQSQPQSQSQSQSQQQQQQDQSSGGILALPYHLIAGTLRLVGRVATSILPSAVTAPFTGPPGPVISPEQQFYQDFRRQYVNGPAWVQGSYSDACRVARNASRMLFVYLHCSTHDDTDTFIRDTLCSEMLCDFLRENFISWVGSIKHAEAYRLCHTLHATAFPFVAVLAPHQQQMAVVLRHTGPISPEDLIAQLVLRMEAHRAIIQQQQQRANIQAMEQAQRSMARNLIQEQDREYQEALEADRQRTLAAEREAREHALELERQAAAAREAEEAAARERRAMEEKVAQRESKRAALGPEPDASATVVSVSIRIPTGRKYERRFHLNDEISKVFNYVETLDLDDGGDHIDKYQIISNFPRQVHHRSNATIKSLNLGRKVMLFVEALYDEEPTAAVESEPVTTAE